VLLWIKSVVEECGENISKEQLKDYVWKTLNSGKVGTHLCEIYLFHLFIMNFMNRPTSVCSLE
jgi:hypothetical protein